MVLDAGQVEMFKYVIYLLLVLMDGFGCRAG